MATFKSADNRLLNESYSVILLKESAPTLTLGYLKNTVSLMNESEAEYICTVLDRIVSEGIFGGLGNVAKGAYGAAKGAYGAAKGAGQSLGSKVGSAVDSAKNFGSNVGAGLKSAGQQVGSNIKNAYETGNTAQEAGKWSAKAEEYVNQLIPMLQQAQQKGLLPTKGDVKQMTLNDVVQELLMAKQGADTQAQGMNSPTAGVGKSFKRGFQGNRPQATPAQSQRSAVA